MELKFNKEQEERYKVLFGDCLIQLKTIQSNSVDAVITDPPYSSGGFSEAQKMSAKSMGIDSKRLKEMEWFPSDNMTTAGMIYLIRACCLEFDRVLKPNTSLLMFTDWRMVINLVPVIESCGFRFRNIIVWDKGSPGLGNGFRPTHEMIMHFVKGKSKFYSGKGSNVIREKRVTPKKRVHHTQKPTLLLKRLIEVVTDEGQTVLDPFFGSGSVGEACMNMNRSVIGIEKSSIHYHTAKERLDNCDLEDKISLFGSV